MKKILAAALMLMVFASPAFAAKRIITIRATIPALARAITCRTIRPTP